MFLICNFKNAAEDAEKMLSLLGSHLLRSTASEVNDLTVGK